ncbi:MAG: M20/M25/M40 family metallo-hydrolase [Sutterellaceae bacterium]|nr:M20/M25/M40 family metallo-hydrolase [Sutterellaceae bacterium]MDD7442771.1 M20/M25/M40 family metallo-hydrolase [Sutterellaceae bacterium]MDY2867618.1 M20/M25/M40 family metallo-hydrolase [Mesosutterella sp.]
MTDNSLAALFSRVDELRPRMMETWAKLVNRDCGSRNKAGVDGVGSDVRAFLEACGYRVSFREYEKAGNMLIAEKGDMTKPFVVLLGHLDTVFADGEAARRPFTIGESGLTVSGPGALDMKGGVTIMLYAAKILSEVGWDRYPVKIILAGDEEVGHCQSGAADAMAEEADGALMGFNFETSYEDNALVVGRKGAAQFRLDVKGVGAHAGNNPRDGRNAVSELCRKEPLISALTDWDEGTSINFGVIHGGTVANAIPENAYAVVDVRYKKMAGYRRVKKALQEIADRVIVEGTKTTLRQTISFAAMERNEKSDELFARVNAIAVEAGLPEMHPIEVGGASDSAYLILAGVPTVCALGVKGRFNHTVREYAVIDSLFEREKLILAVLSKI